MLELVRQGNASPNAVEVAARARVGLRSVFRHFKEMESLYVEIMGVVERELMAVVAQPFKGTTWRERVLELVERRGPVFETIAPLRRAADARLTESKVLRANYNTLALRSREILRRIVPLEATDAATFEALDLLLSFEAWSRLRNDQDLSPTRARQVLSRAVTALVGEDA